MTMIGEGPEALALFTDRDAAVRGFLDALHADGDATPILVFEGEAGVGKSLLLRHLHVNGCKRFPLEDWSHIRTAAADDFASRPPRTWLRCPPRSSISTTTAAASSTSCSRCGTTWRRQDTPASGFRGSTMPPCAT